MSGGVENGRRLDVAFGGYEGQAGVVVRDGTTRVAFPATRRSLRGCAAGLVDGVPVRITGIEDSPVVRGFVVLTVEPLA